MRLPPLHLVRALAGQVLLATLCLGLSGAAGCGKGPSPASSNTNAPPKPSSGATSAPVLVALSAPQAASAHVTAFVITNTGRNPFFPGSAPAGETNTEAAAPPVAAGHLVLKQILGKKNRTAWINNQTFKPGEESKLKLPDGRVIRVKCLEIREKSVLLEVEGMGRKELVLRP